MIVLRMGNIKGDMLGMGILAEKFVLPVRPERRIEGTCGTDNTF
jgi:hypothetical protein